jgi:hypothetical protein
MLDPPSARVVKEAIHAWNDFPPADVEHIPDGILPVGEPILIEPITAIEVLLWTHVQGQTMALVS